MRTERDRVRRSKGSTNTLSHKEAQRQKRRRSRQRRREDREATKDQY